MDERIESIKLIRGLIAKYIKGQIAFSIFYGGISSELGSVFDPFDWTTEDLSEDLKNELKLYSKLTGGEFGEHEDFIPKRADWNYGESVEKYGWIDKDKYKVLLKEEISRIKLKNI